MKVKVMFKVLKRGIASILFRILKLVKEEEMKLWDETKKTESRNFDHDTFRYPYLSACYEKVLSCVKNKSRYEYYSWGVIFAADLAQALGLKNISIIEFGVAGGNGLVHMEEVVPKIEEIFNVSISIYGFDTGKGLPKPKDYRDLPHLWQEGAFPMDLKMLQEKLRRSKLVLGPVSETIEKFIRSKPPRIGFIAFDLDLYSSTRDAFRLFEASNDLFLPRIHCYFDDILGFSYSEFNGERLAIREFNQINERKKIDKINGLSFFLNQQLKHWHESMYLLHLFDHDMYLRYDGMLRRSLLPLD